MYSHTDVSQVGELDDVDGALFSRVPTKAGGRGELNGVDGALFSRVSTKDSGRGELDGVDGVDGVDGALFSRVSTKAGGRGELNGVDGALFSRVSTKDSGRGELDDVDGALFSRVSTTDIGRDTNTVTTMDSAVDIQSPVFEQIHNVDSALFSRISTQEIGAELILPVTNQSQIEKENVIRGCHYSYSKLQDRIGSRGQNQTKSDNGNANDRHKDNRNSSPNCYTVDRPPLSNRSAPCNLDTQCLELPPNTRYSVTQDSIQMSQRPVVAELSSMLGSVPYPLDIYSKNSESRTEIVENDTVDLDECNWASNPNDSMDYVEGSEPIVLEQVNLCNEIPALQSTLPYINQKEQLLESSVIPSQRNSACYLNECDTEHYANSIVDVTESTNIPSRKSCMFYLDEDTTDDEQQSTEGKKVIKRLNNNITTRDTTSYDSLKNISRERSSSGYGKDATDAKCTIDSNYVALDNLAKRLLPPNIPAGHSEVLNEPKTDTSEKRHKRVIWPVVRSLTCPIISMCVYFWDIGSDVRLAISYRDNGDTNLFWITMSCIVIPLILMSVVDVSWLWLDRPSFKPSHVLRYVIGVLTLGRVARAMQYMWHLFKSNTVLDEAMLAWHKKRATEEGRDCYILDFINAFAESAPQLFVQMYLMYAYNLELTTVRTLNLLSSWISIAWTYAAYYRCNRAAVTGTQDIKFISFTIFFFSVLSALAVRVICIVFFLVTFKIWIGGILLSVHLITMLFWIILKEKPKLEGTASSIVGKCMYYIFFAYVSLLCFLNLQNTPAKQRMTAFYILLYIENFIMALLSFYRMNVLETWNEKLLHLLVLPIGFSLHVLLLIAYYQLCHPKTGMLNK